MPTWNGDPYNGPPIFGVTPAPAPSPETTPEPGKPRFGGTPAPEGSYLVIPPPPPTATWGDFAKGVGAGLAQPPVNLMNNIAKGIEYLVPPSPGVRPASAGLTEAQTSLDQTGTPTGRAIGRTGTDIALSYGLARLGVPPVVSGALIGAGSPAESLNQFVDQTAGGSIAGGAMGLGAAVAPRIASGLMSLAGKLPTALKHGLANTFGVAGGLELYNDWDRIKEHPELLGLLAIPALASPAGRAVVRGLTPAATGAASGAGAYLGGHPPDITGLLPYTGPQY